MMSGMQNAVGTVVEKDPSNPLPPVPNDGLYLFTEDGKLFRLIEHGMQTQMSIDYMHQQSRTRFEPYLGQSVIVEGYFSRSSIYSARVVELSEASPDG